jgi:hypothetical protein
MTHKVLVLMLDPWFKNLQLVRNYMGFDMAMHIVVVYDRGMLMPFLFIVYNKLTPTLRSFLNMFVIWA